MIGTKGDFEVQHFGGEKQLPKGADTSRKELGPQEIMDVFMRDSGTQETSQVGNQNLENKHGSSTSA